MADDRLWDGRRRVTADDYEQVKALHAQHLSRNEIARRLNRSPHTITKIAKELGLSFARGDSPGLREATEARRADARARRAALAIKLLDDAERMRQQLFAPLLVYNFGGKDNTFNQHEIPEPGPRDKRDLMQAISLAIERSVRLDEYDSGANLGNVVSLLESLGRGLAAKYGDDAEPDA